MQTRTTESGQPGTHLPGPKHKESISVATPKTKDKCNAEINKINKPKRQPAQSCSMRFNAVENCHPLPVFFDSKPTQGKAPHK